MRVTAAEAAELIARQARKTGTRAPNPATEPRGELDPNQYIGDRRKAKYGNVRTEVDGLRFDSKREAAYFSELKLRVKAGEVLWFIRQVAFDLPGGSRYFADFMEVHKNGTVHVVDVKGVETQVFKLKSGMFTSRYGFDIEVVK